MDPFCFSEFPFMTIDLWFVIVAFAFLTFAIIFRRIRGNKREQMKRLVESVNQQVDYNPDAEFAPVDLHSIPGINLSFHDRVTLEMEPLGFRPGSDFENLSWRKSTPWQRNATRPFFSRDGSVVASCSHHRIQGWRRLLLSLFGKRKVIDDFITNLHTELGDGTIISTSRSNATRTYSRPADCILALRPASTPLPELLQHHRQRIRQEMAERGNESFHQIRNQEEYQAFLRLLLSKLDQHHQAKGGLTPEDFECLDLSLDNRSHRTLVEEAEKFRHSRIEERPTGKV